MTDHTKQTTTPELPPEVFAELLSKSLEVPGCNQRGRLASLAYAAGADAGVEACCEWLEEDPFQSLTRGQVAGILRSALRPKSPSLKEQALKAAQIELDPDGTNGALIIRALESLPDAD